ncbi:MAG: hypothetical protein PHO37_04605 [Kiritimatiellae bacterium]|nr:hypothetical protein [Kiritimatiellia bacterium]
MNKKTLNPLLDAMQKAFIQYDHNEMAVACREWESSIHALNVYAKAARGVEREAVIREQDPDIRVYMRATWDLSQWWTPEILRQLHACKEFEGRRWIRAEATLAHDIEMARSVGTQLLAEIKDHLADEEARMRERLHHRALFEKTTIILAESFLNGTMATHGARVYTATAPGDYVFAAKGNFWQIVYDGLDLGLFKHHNGLIYIHNLLSRPGQSIPIQEMQIYRDKFAEPVIVTPDTALETKVCKGIGFSGRTLKLSDPNFSTAVLRLQAELQEQLSRETDADEYKAIADKLIRLAVFLRLAAKRGRIGCVKFNPDEPIGPGRDVGTCIWDTINMFKESDEGQDLSDYLTAHIETGARCRYTGETTWHV